MDASVRNCRNILHLKPCTYGCVCIQHNKTIMHHIAYTHAHSLDLSHNHTHLVVISIHHFKTCIGPSCAIQIKYFCVCTQPPDTQC